MGSICLTLTRQLMKSASFFYILHYSVHFILFFKSFIHKLSLKALRLPFTNSIFFNFSLQFDSKSSPLALLAQTCSAIGSDQPNPKLLANIEKSQKSCKQDRDKLSPGSTSTLSNSSSTSDTPKSSFKPYEPNFREKTTHSPPDKPKQLSKTTPPPPLSVSNNIQPLNLNGRCESNQSATSRDSGNRTPIVTGKSSPNRTSKESHSLSQAQSLDTRMSESAKEKSLPSTSVPSFIPSTSASTSSSSPYMSSFTTPSFPYPMDLMALNAHHAALKAAALNPYLNYARLKMQQNGESMMPPICRDPYCTGCTLSSHNMMGKCPAGCVQCDHPSKTHSTYPSLSTTPSYAHAQLAAIAAASQMPYVCNWIAGDSSYCGKRFATSEELFTHLRTQHTTGTTLSESMLNPAIAAAMASGIPPTHPLFQRNYSASALSPLSATRYHPYSKPGLPLPSSLPGFPMPPHPSLASYFSPYSLYGPR